MWVMVCNKQEYNLCVNSLRSPEFIRYNLETKEVVKLPVWTFCCLPQHELYYFWDNLSLTLAISSVKQLLSFSCFSHLCTTLWSVAPLGCDSFIWMLELSICSHQQCHHQMHPWHSHFSISSHTWLFALRKLLSWNSVAQLSQSPFSCARI